MNVARTDGFISHLFYFILAPRTSEINHEIKYVLQVRVACGNFPWRNTQQKK